MCFWSMRARLRAPMSGLVDLSCVKRPVLRTTEANWALMCVENVLVRTARKRGGPSEEKKGLLSKKRDVSLARKQKNRPGTAPDLLSSGYRGETSCPAFRRYRYKFHSAGH